MPFPSPIPDHEWSVLALHSNKTEAHPVRAHTWIILHRESAFFFMYLISADLPVPPGPVINIF